MNIMNGSMTLTIALLASLTPLLAHANTVASSPEVALGLRLFNETRFAEYFAREAGSSLNDPLYYGDPTLEEIETLTGLRPHPLRGLTTSCAACHLTTQSGSLGVRVFTDFARRSRIPERSDGLTHTLRNSPTIVGTALPGLMTYLHFDGEFPTAAALAKGGLTGRNFGWLKNEGQKAIQHIARVIREDRAPSWTLDSTTKGSLPYATAFASLGLDVRRASDEAVVDFASARIGDFMASQDFGRNVRGEYEGSPYDKFLEKNGLPRKPFASETPIAYMNRLTQLVQSIRKPIWVNSEDGRLKNHDQSFSFGPAELRGMIAFSTRGQCLLCHSAPDFTDHLAHNIGVTQEEYDSTHGFGKFGTLQVPTLANRLVGDIDRLSRAPIKGQAELADLGAWTMLFNPAVPNAQARLREVLARSLEIDLSQVSNDELLNSSLAVFKTPTLRNLGLSAPYMHSGHLDTLEEVIMFYIRSPNTARRGYLRNSDPKLLKVAVGPGDIDDVAAFLRALNEDIAN